MTNAFFDSLFSIIFSFTAAFVVLVPAALVVRRWWKLGGVSAEKEDGDKAPDQKTETVMKYFLRIAFSLWALLIVIVLTWSILNTLK
jgi:hypothetical protein